MKEQRILQCDFCWRMCRINPNETGWCGVRANRNGNLVTLGYGELVSCAVDPIEKKTFYHFLTGIRTLSAALFGCNFRCAFCQNFEISQPGSLFAPGLEDNRRKSKFSSPKDLVHRMLDAGLESMTYTYSDPVVWQDYMLDTADLVHKAGGLNCMVTNGSFTESSMERVLPLIDGFNIDLKGDDAFYRRWCAGSLKPVLRTIEAVARRQGTVLEVTTLVIEGLHSREDIAELGRMLSDCGVKVWHLSKFFPYYQMLDRKPTREEFLLACLETAQDSGIPHIYAGNSSSSKWTATRCPSCGEELISSHSYLGEAAVQVKKQIRNGLCVHCGAEIYGRYSLS